MIYAVGSPPEKPSNGQWDRARSPMLKSVEHQLGEN